MLKQNSRKMGVEEICALMAITYGLLEFAHKAANKETNQWLTNWLKKVNPSEDNQWDTRFIQFFDRIYDSKPFSKKRLFRSALSSVVLAVILILFVLIVAPPSMIENVEFETRLKTALSMIFGMLIFNTAPDIISLIETRWIVQRMVGYGSAVKILLLFLDLVLTLLILFIWLLLLFSITGEKSIIDLLEDFSQGLQWKDPYVAIYVYTSLFTSFWIWIYLIGGFIIRKLNIARARIFKTLTLFDIDKSPLRVIGLMASIAVGLVSTILTLAL